MPWPVVAEAETFVLVGLKQMHLALVVELHPFLSS